MAVMFDGRIVQQGPTQQVWANPRDRQVAEFIGFGTFLEGAAADVVRGAVSAEEVDLDGPTLALRRSALWVSGSGPLSATVLSASAISDAVRVDLELDGVGPVEALAAHNAVLQPGDRVQVLPYVTGMAAF